MNAPRDLRRLDRRPEPTTARAASDGGRSHSQALGPRSAFVWSGQNPRAPDLRNQRLAERARLTFGDGQGQDHAAHEEGPNGIRRRIHPDG